MDQEVVAVGALEEEWEEEMNHEVVGVASREVEVAAGVEETQEVKVGVDPEVGVAAEVVQATGVEVKPAAVGETPGAAAAAAATKDTNNNGTNKTIPKVLSVSS